ncbi:cupin domain-containing protein [Marinobacterium mangrovicola]|uniref:Cupin domain-containing protein n=1 Tax=Marinobacterium mangrovicola TaxID=1476959 RepID=A0A4R1GGG4_9GAMM|nr:cupin domain-containing protein [Marinobacterium mangrovicola]TCK07557.1 Cupin domain-containing protein [Marinobacterium mangrovicola]
MSFPPIHRVVTGHDAEGNAVVASEGAPPKVVEIESIPGTIFHEIWATGATPAIVDNGEDPTLGDLQLSPPASGTRIRIVDIPPDSEEFLARGAEAMDAAFSQIGEVEASTVKADSPHPLMHRTETVDYGILLEGELVLVLDRGEVTLKPGSVVVQRGTNHAWANRSGKPCRIAFILVDGRYDPALAEALEAR